MKRFVSTTLLDGLDLPVAPRWHKGTLYFSDMGGHRILSLDKNGRSSIVCALDAEGSVWMAMPFTWELVRVDKTGEITHGITMPKGKGVFACHLGGDDRRTLYFTSGLSGTLPESSKTPHMGFVDSVRVDVPGAGWP